ncbi:nucleoside hydrolase [Gorillibacterium sp. CAU 1737]|uniref:nucleoside hydrolase n=1 Tax=Gorillibacterium sp. CAU 1737 TaxID=3140362 RepID=UPI003261167D
MTHNHRLLIDADTGIDDALAILYALRMPGVQVEGITTVFGNTSAEQAAENTLRLLEFADPGCSIPVLLGADRPLLRPLHPHSSHVHGENGLGGVELPRAPRSAGQEPAPDFLVRKVNESPGELTLVTLASFTNLALALELDPELPRKVKGVVSMAGTIDAPGNVTPVAEANVYKDPEAADRVLTSGLPITLVGLDVTMPVRLSKGHLRSLADRAKPEEAALVRFMAEASEAYWAFYGHSNFFVEEAPMHDLLAMQAALCPELFTFQHMPLRVECGGALTTGMVVADRRAIPREGTGVNVCVGVHAERAIGQFLSVFAQEA